MTETKAVKVPKDLPSAAEMNGAAVLGAHEAAWQGFVTYQVGVLGRKET